MDNMASLNKLAIDIVAEEFGPTCEVRPCDAGRIHCICHVIRFVIKLTHALVLYLLQAVAQCLTGLGPSTLPEIVRGLPNYLSAFADNAAGTQIAVSIRTAMKSLRSAT